MDMSFTDKLEFMKKFAEIRQTQPNDGNRAPVFWLILNQNLERCGLDEATEYSLHLEGANLGPAEYDKDELESLKQDILSDIENNYKDELEAQVYNSDIDGFCKCIGAASDVNDIYNTLEEYDEIADILGYETDLTGFRWVYTPVMDHMFLTKEAAQQHIADYHYRYKNPKTYANTCLESQYMQTLFSIIDDPNFWKTISEIADNAWLPDSML